MPVVNQAYGNDRQGIWLEWVHLRKSSPGVLTKSQLKAHRVNPPAMAGRSAPGEHTTASDHQKPVD